MSIATSPEERQAAIERLANTSPEQLERDLAYWAIAKVDHQGRYIELTNERFKATELYKEADAWVILIAEELAGRRPRATS